MRRLKNLTRPLPPKVHTLLRAKPIDWRSDTIFSYGKHKACIRKSLSEIEYSAKKLSTEMCEKNPAVLSPSCPAITPASVLVFEQGAKLLLHESLLFE